MNYAALATLTEGYAAMDLKDLVSRAVQNAAERTLINAKGRLDYDAAGVRGNPSFARRVDDFLVSRN